MSMEIEVFHKGQLYIGDLEGNTIWCIIKWCVIDECELPMTDQEALEVGEIFAEMGYALD